MYMHMHKKCVYNHEYNVNAHKVYAHLIHVHVHVHAVRGRLTGVGEVSQDHTPSDGGGCPLVGWPGLGRQVEDGVRGSLLRC